MVFSGSANPRKTSFAKALQNRAYKLSFLGLRGASKPIEPGVVWQQGGSRVAVYADPTMAVLAALCRRMHHT